MTETLGTIRTYVMDNVELIMFGLLLLGITLSLIQTFTERDIEPDDEETEWEKRNR